MGFGAPLHTLGQALVYPVRHWPQPPAPTPQFPLHQFLQSPPLSFCLAGSALQAAEYGNDCQYSRGYKSHRFAQAAGGIQNYTKLSLKPQLSRGGG